MTRWLVLEQEDDCEVAGFVSQYRKLTEFATDVVAAKGAPVNTHEHDVGERIGSIEQRALAVRARHVEAATLQMGAHEPASATVAVVYDCDS